MFERTCKYTRRHPIQTHLTHTTHNPTNNRQHTTTTPHTSTHTHYGYLLPCMLLQQALRPDMLSTYVQMPQMNATHA